MAKEVLKNKKTGLWYWYIKMPDGLYKRRENKNWTREIHAQRALDAWRMEQSKKTELGIDSSVAMTFDKLFELYHDYKETGNTKSSTNKTVKYYYKNHMKPFFKKMDVLTIDVTTLDLYQKYLLTKTYTDRITKETKKYTNHYLSKVQYQLNDIFDFAVNRKLMLQNPFALSLIKQHTELEEESDEITIIEEKDFMKFLNVAKAKSFVDYALYLTYYFVGCRPGEGVALNIESFNQEDSTITINRNWDENAKKLTTTKNKSKRVCYIPPVLKTALINLIASYPQEYVNPRAPLFGLTDRFTEKDLRAARVEYCKSAKIKYFSRQTLRHTNVTMLLEAGFSTLEISKRTGHSEKTLLKYYAHISKKRLESLNTKVDRIGNKFK